MNDPLNRDKSVWDVKSEKKRHMLVENLSSLKLL